MCHRPLVFLVGDVSVRELWPFLVAYEMEIMGVALCLCQSVPLATDVDS